MDDLGYKHPSEFPESVQPWAYEDQDGDDPSDLDETIQTTIISRPI